MKAVVFHGVGDVRLDDVPEPHLQKSTDAIVRITASAICGTDLHLIRGTVPGMKPGTIIGHEAVGIVETIGADVRNVSVKDRVVVASTIACGACAYCRVGYFAQCDGANPNGVRAGTCFFGGPEGTGAVDGLQAEHARIPNANVGLVKLPDKVTDDQALALSDILPTAWFASRLAEIEPGNTVAIFGCGPVGQLAITTAAELGAGRIFAVDTIATRIKMARGLGAEAIDFDKDDPIETILDLTSGIGVDRAIDAVGVDANAPRQGPAAAKAAALRAEFEEEAEKLSPPVVPVGDNWRPGNAPTQALRWAVEVLAKAGTLSIVGVYPQTLRSFPIGEAMNKNLTIQMGNCNHRKYIPHLLEMVRSGALDPSKVVTHRQPLGAAIDAYRAYDRRLPGWIKVKLEPALAA